VQRVKLALCKLAIDAFFTLERLEVLRTPGNTKAGERESDGGENAKSGGSDPTFSAFAAQKVAWGHSRPPARRVVPHLFHGDQDSKRNTNQLRRNTMPIVKKAPEVMAREIRLEQPVNELLEDYARFIESSPDHVVNAVLKKVLWRDLDYRKWRGERRAPQPGSDKSQPIDGRARG
jgi:hypothetical protein